jgi:hypothetical protein
MNWSGYHFEYTLGPFTFTHSNIVPLLSITPSRISTSTAKLYGLGGQAEEKKREAEKLKIELLSIGGHAGDRQD